MKHIYIYIYCSTFRILVKPHTIAMIHIHTHTRTLGLITSTLCPWVNIMRCGSIKLIFMTGKINNRRTVIQHTESTGSVLGIEKHRAPGKNIETDTGREGQGGRERARKCVCENKKSSAFTIRAPFFHALAC